MVGSVLRRWGIVVVTLVSGHAADEITRLLILTGWLPQD